MAYYSNPTTGGRVVIDPFTPTGETTSRMPRYTETPNTGLSMGKVNPKYVVQWLSDAIRQNPTVQRGPLSNFVQAAPNALGYTYGEGLYQQMLGSQGGFRRDAPSGTGTAVPQGVPQAVRPGNPWLNFNYAAETRKSIREAPAEQGSTNPFETQDVIQDAWQRQYDQYLAQMQAEEDKVKAGYQPAIEAAEDQIGDLRAAAAALGIPFDEYLRQRAAIGGDIDEAPGLGPTMEPVITKIYDDKQGEMKKVLAKIDMDFGPKVAAQVTGRMDEFENVIKDVIRTDESALSALHEKKGEYAQALARSAYSNDIYAAMDAETKINAQLDFAIEEAREDLARQKRARDAAIKAAQDGVAAAFPWEEPTFDGVVDDAWNEYFEKEGVPIHERENAKIIFGELISDPSNTLNDSTWRKAVTENMNIGILKTLGYDADAIQKRIDSTADRPDGGDTQLMYLLANRDVGKMFKTGQTMHLRERLLGAGFSQPEVNRIIAQGSKNADSYQSLDRPEFKHLQNMFTTRNDISTNWDKYVASFGPLIDEGSVYRAPNGYVLPVAGGAKFSNDWGNPRDGGARSHEGTDMFAKRGTPVLAPVTGVVSGKDYGEKGGNFLFIKEPDGTRHYLAHMDGYSANIQIGTKVSAGQMVGTVGDTGNAKGTSPHLHYGIYLPNGKASNPYPIVNAALSRRNPPRYGSGGVASGKSSHNTSPKTKKSYKTDKRTRYG